MEEKVLMKKGTVFVVGIISFLFALVIGVAVCYYFIGYDQSEYVKQEEEDNDNFEVINVAEVDNLITSYEGISGIESLTSIIYNEVSIDDKLIEITVLSELGFPDEISLNDFLYNVEKFFGIDVATSYVPDNFTFDIYNYFYDEKENIFTSVVEGGYGGTGFPWQIRKLFSVALDNDILKAQVAVGMCQSVILETYYSTYDCENLDSTFKVEDAQVNFNIDEDYENLTKFEYTFKYSAENESFYIVDIEMID